MVSFLLLTVEYFPFVYFIITAGLLLSFKQIKKFIKPAVILLLVLKIIELVTKIAEQYFAFKNSDVGIYLLPPYQQINQFFFQYIDYRLIYPIIFPILIGLLFYFLTKIFNYFGQGQYFESEEPWMIFYAIIFVGHPWWIVYIFLIFIIGIILYLGQIFFKKINFGQRLPLYYLWLPLAIIFFLFQGFSISIPYLTNFLNSISF